METKKVNRAVFQTKDGYFELTPKKDVAYFYEEQNLGEYGIGWIIEYHNGIEMSRHNCIFAVSIEWYIPQ